MNNQTNRPADRPRWVTPPEAVPIRAVKPTGDGRAPVPTASRFRRRIVRACPARQRYTTVRDWGQLAPGELEAMPEGARRSVALSPSVHLTLIRGADGWTMNTRRGIPSEALAGMWTAPRVPVDPDGVQ